MDQTNKRLVKINLYESNIYMEYILIGSIIVLSLLLGFGIGIFSGLYFRKSFKEFCADQVEATQKILDEQLIDVQTKARDLVASANQEAYNIVQAATEHVLETNLSLPNKQNMN